MNANAIRAGKAFVEMFMTDERVDAVLDRVQTKLKAFGGVVDQVGNRSFSGMEAAATTSTVATGAQVGLLSSGMLFLGATVGAVGRAINVTFAKVTTSVTAATIRIGALAWTLGSLTKGTRFAGVLDGFLSKSQSTEAVGRWSRFWGLITGSRVLRDVGDRIERAGMGMAIVRGFRQSGIAGALNSTLGVAVRSAQSAAFRGVAGAIVAPFRWAFAGARSAVASFVPALDVAATRTDGTTASITRAAGAARVMSTSSFSLGKALGSVALKLGAFSAAILGPAIGAAKSFVTSSQEMVKANKETGESLDSLIAKKYGANSLISASDVQAAAELGTMMTQLKQAVAAAWAQIGAAALPILRDMTRSSLGWANTIVFVLKNNRELITTVVRVARKVAGIAAAIAAAAGAMMALGPVLGMVLSPIGLVVAGIAAIAYAFPELRQEALSTFGWLFGNFGELGSIVTETIGGIQDALMGGNLKAAADVLWAGLKLAWLSGTEQLRAVWNQMTNTIASFGVNVFSSFRKAWVETTRFLGAAWHDVLGAMRSVWQSTQNWFAKGFARVVAKISGQDVNEVLATLEEMQKQESQGDNSLFAQKMRETEAVTQEKLAGIEAERLAMQEALKEELEGRQTAAKAELDAARAAFTQSRENARKLRPDLKAAVEEPGKKKKEAQERNSELISSADIRSQEGLAGALKAIFSSDKAAETANNTKQTTTLLGVLGAKVERSNTLLDRIHRDAGNDVVPLNQAATAS